MQTWRIMSPKRHPSLRRHAESALNKIRALFRGAQRRSSFHQMIIS
jgi:hypothetical protein